MQGLSPEVISSILSLLTEVVPAHDDPIDVSERRSSILEIANKICVESIGERQSSNEHDHPENHKEVEFHQNRPESSSWSINGIKETRGNKRLEQSLA